MDFSVAHQYRYHPQGEEYCTESSEDGELCGLPLSQHPHGESTTTD